jgi:hypothetical protein
LLASPLLVLLPSQVLPQAHLLVLLLALQGSLQVLLLQVLHLLLLALLVPQAPESWVLGRAP